MRSWTMYSMGVRFEDTNVYKKAKAEADRCAAQAKADPTARNKFLAKAAADEVRRLLDQDKMADCPAVDDDEM